MTSERIACKISSSLKGNEIPHALVDFVTEECIAVVPSNRLSGDLLSMKEGEDVEVLWNNGKKYTAKFLLLGSRKDCEAKQTELDPEGDQTESTTINNRKGSEDDHAKSDINSEKQGENLKEEKENIAPCVLPKKKRKRKLIQKDIPAKAKRPAAGRPKKQKEKEEGNFIVAVGPTPPREAKNGGKELPAHGHEHEQTLVNDGDQGCNSTECVNSESANSNGSDEYSDYLHQLDNYHNEIIIPYDDDDHDNGDRTKTPIHFTGGIEDTKYDDIMQDMLSVKEDVASVKATLKSLNGAVKVVSSVTQDLVSVKTTMNSLNNAVKVLSKEVNFHLQSKGLMNPFRGSIEAYASTEAVNLPQKSSGSIQLFQNPGIVRQELPRMSDMLQGRHELPRYTPQQVLTSLQVEQGSSTLPGVATTQPLEPAMTSFQTMEGLSMSGEVPTAQSLEEEQALVSFDGPSASVGMPTLQSFAGEPSQETPLPDEYLSQSELTQVFMKSCSRKNMAVLLTRRLFSQEIRMSSNVSGRNKKQLNPQVMEFIRRKVFVFFPSTQVNTSKEWADCIVAVDESSRHLKNKPPKCTKTSP